MALTPNLLDLSWNEEIADGSEEFRNGVISILDPDLVGTAYDPVTDEGGAADPAVLIDHRDASIQQIRLPVPADGSMQSAAQRRYRFKFEAAEGDPFLRVGLIVRVDDGGEDPSLEQLRFHISGGTGSSHMAVRTIEASTEQVPA
jgi:hypothetical protein